jgi:hypothetical protein
VAGFGRVPPPQVPVTKPWPVSIASLLPVNACGSGLRSKILGRALDNFGSFRLDPTGVELNGVRVDWRRVEVIRVRDTLELLLETSSARLTERISNLVPWFVPGRAAVTGYVVGLVFDLVSQIAHRVLTAGRIPDLVPGEIVCRGRFGAHERVELGIFGLLVVSLVPGVNENILAAAHAHRILAAVEQRPVDPGEAHHRAHVLLSQAEELHQRVRHLRGSGGTG